MADIDMAPVLIIDADSAATALLSLGMRQLGLSASIVRTLQDGLRVVSSQALSAVVAEQVLPDGSVLSVLARMRELAPWVKTVILTRHASVSAAVLAIRSGAAGYLSKPAGAAEVATELGLFSSGKDCPLTPEHGSRMTLEQVEWEYINRVMLTCGGNLSEASRQLRMHRRSLQRRLARGGPPVSVAQRSPQSNNDSARFRKLAPLSGTEV